MKKLFLPFLCLITIYSCSNDDDVNIINNNTPIIEDLVYSEAVDGDLSNDSNAPTTIMVTAGDNRVVSDQMSGNTDYFTIVVPDGHQLAQIVLDTYDGADPAFI